jgi:hypothetical protein
LAILAACDLPSASSSRVLEVKCEQDTGFDADKLCSKPDRLGAELEIKVNANTQKVQISILKNYARGWFIKDLILDTYSVVDTDNWKCKEPFSKEAVSEYGMVRGRYYSSLTGENPPESYTSSVSGLTFWALHYGAIALPQALTTTGYSTPVVRAFGKSE